MSAAPIQPPHGDTPTQGHGTALFSSVYVTLTKQEHIQLKTDAQYWQTLHRKALGRAQWREQRYQRIVRELKAQASDTQAKLIADLAFAQAQIRDLRKRLFSAKSERKRGSELRSKDSVSRAHRGQSRGTRGHGRTLQTQLPARHEYVGIDTPQCPRCGLALKIFPGTEDAQVLEIEVKAYRRVIHRHRYVPSCQCGCVSGIVTAPPPARLINRGKFGISVWTSALLDKFVYGRPSHRLLQDLADHGLEMAPATLAGGLQMLAPLFKPLEQALLAKLRSEPHWHADETRWSVFVEVAGKVGHRWYMWVFHSRSAVHYVVDPTRAAEVIQTELAGVDRGIISCDRYSGYKRFARLNPGVVLAYCWAHQRRDFLDLANSYPDLSPWAFEWVQAIGELYHLNGLRLRLAIGSEARTAAHCTLEQAVKKMADACAACVINPQLSAPAAKVLESMRFHWSGLTVFVDSPWVPMDNNTAERDIRGPVVGRKSFYGSGSKCSAELAATMYSLMATIELWRINARTWLGAYLQACADNANQAPDDINTFLPWAMDAKRLAQMRGVPTGAAPLVQGFDSS